MSIFVIINVAVTSCGLVLAILSSIVFFSVSPFQRDKKEDLETLFAVYASCVIVFGALIALAALITMVITTCPSFETERCTRKFYPISLGVLSVGLVTGSVLCMILSPMANRALEPSFANMYSMAINGSSGKDVDQLQTERECCGYRPMPVAGGYAPVVPRMVFAPGTPLPPSCCPSNETHHCDGWNAYKHDCLYVFRITFDRAINHIAMWALSVVTFLIISIVLILCTNPR